MNDFEKFQRIKKLSKIVCCFKGFRAKVIEILLLVLHFIIIILCLINIYISKDVINDYLFGLRIVIFCFFGASFFCLIYNQILRLKRKLYIGFFYCFGFFGTLFSMLLIILNFFFIIILFCTSIINLQKKSILIIDICSVLPIILMIFLWFSEFLRVYAKTDGALKDYIEAKTIFYQTQNQKEVNIELGEVNSTEFKKNKINDNTMQNFNKIERKNGDDEIISDIKMEINNEKQINDIKNNKKDEISSVDTK